MTAWTCCGSLCVSSICSTFRPDYNVCWETKEWMVPCILFVLLDSLFTLLSFLESTPVLTISEGSLVFFQLSFANKESQEDDQREARQTLWVFSVPVPPLWNSSQVFILLTLKTISLRNPPQFILNEYTIFIILRPWLIH